MKKLKLLTLLIAVIFFSSCNNDDDNKTTETTIAGNWNLIEINSTIMGGKFTFAPGVITWNFNTTTNTFTVVNNNTDASAIYIFNSGTYPYEIIASPIANSICNQSIELNDADYGCLLLTSNSLQINDGAADGIVFKFIR